MAEIEPLFVGKTFDDFLFRPQRTPVSSRREVSLAMPLAGEMRLALPILGANMDTVVGEEMAKTLALEGAFGFLHRNASIADAGRARPLRQDAPLVRHRQPAVARAHGHDRRGAPGDPPVQREQLPGRGGEGRPEARRDPVAPRHAARNHLRRSAGVRVHDAAPPARDAAAHGLARGGRAGDVRAPGREAAARRRAGAAHGPCDDARPEALQAEAALDEGRARPAAG